MTDRVDELVARVESQRQFHTCTVHALFEELVSFYRNSDTAPWQTLRALIDEGLRLLVQPLRVKARQRAPEVDEQLFPRGKLTEEIEAAIAKAEEAGRIDAPCALVAVEKNTANEHYVALCDFYVMRFDLERACCRLGVKDLPWPDDEFQTAWEFQQLEAEVARLKKQRNKYSRLPVKSIEDARLKQDQLDEINRDINVLQNKLGRLSPQPENKPSVALPETTSSKKPRKPPQAQQRDDALARISRQAYKELSKQGEKPTYRRVIQELASYVDEEEEKINNVIESVDFDQECIYWNTDRGDEEMTTFRGFQKRMTRIRNTTPTS